MTISGALDELTHVYACVCSWPYLTCYPDKNWV